MPNDPGQDDFIRITNREIWVLLRQIEKDLTDVKQTLPQVKDNTDKIRTLELKMYWIGAGLVSGLLAVGAAALKGVFG